MPKTNHGHILPNPLSFIHRSLVLSFRSDLEEINIQLEAHQKMEDDLRVQYNEVLGKFSLSDFTSTLVAVAT